MEIARSNPLSIRFSFDPKDLVRQIVEVLVREFGMAEVLTVPAYEPGLAGVALSSRAQPARRPSPYAPRWG